MREDIAKVLVTRPRYAPSSVKPRKNKSDDRVQVSMTRPHKEKYQNKQLNEYLSPLKRFINKQVGRKWDDVYSEIRELIKSGNTVQEHILEHLYDYIAINVHKNEATGNLQTQYGGRRGRFYDMDDRKLYVDPVSGIIKRHSVKNVVKHKPEAKYRLISKDLIVFNVDGIWYEADVKDYVTITREVTYGTGDMAYTTTVKENFTNEGQRIYYHMDVMAPHFKPKLWGIKIMRNFYGRDNAIAINKRQLCKGKLKEYGLTNK